MRDTKGYCGTQRIIIIQGTAPAHLVEGEHFAGVEDHLVGDLPASAANHRASFTSEDAKCREFTER